MKFCYKRVSTVDQNLDRQLHGMEFDREFVEKVSAKNMVDRPQLQGLLCIVREGDEVHVHELSRLARSVKDLIEIVEKIVDEGAMIKFHKENLEFKKSQKKNAFSSLMLNLLGAIAEFERDLTLERQREGITLAKQRGAYKGKQSRFSETEIKRIKNEFLVTDNKLALAKQWGISRGYLYKLATK